MINITHWILICDILGIICLVVLLFRILRDKLPLKISLLIFSLLIFICTLLISLLPAFIDVGYERVTGIECTRDVEEINNKVKKCKGDINVIEEDVKEITFKTETYERKTCFGLIKIIRYENYLLVPNKE